MGPAQDVGTAKYKEHSGGCVELSAGLRNAQRHLLIFLRSDSAGYSGTLRYPVGGAQTRDSTWQTSKVSDPPQVRLGTDLCLAVKTAMLGHSHAVKRERDSLETAGGLAGPGKRGRYEESEPGSDGFGEESFSDRDNSLEGAVTTHPLPSQHMHTVKVGAPQDYTMPSMQTDIPGLEELMSSEMFGPLLRLSPPPSEKDYCFNLDTSEGVCDLFDVL